MRHVVLVTALIAASYVLWVLSSSSELADPPPPLVVSGPRVVERAMGGEEGAPPVLNRPQKRASSEPVGRLSSNLSPSSAQLVEAQEGLALEAPSKETSPLEPPPQVKQKTWAPSRKLEHLTAYGLLGLYTGWLGEAERIGWSVSRDALSISREGVLIHFTSRDGMLQGAEVNLPPLALSDSVMDLWRTLLGEEEERLSLQPPFEREEQGWLEQRSVELPSGRSVELTLRGRSQGEPPYGPERVILTISALRR